MRPTRRAAGVLATAVLLAGCSAPLAPDDEPEARESPTPSARPTPAPTVTRAPTTPSTPRPSPEKPKRAAPPYVVAISVDGLNPTAITQLGPSRLPAFHALLEGGATTLNARTALEQTETLPNHTGMLTGRPIRGPDGHGVTINKDNGSGTIEATSVFDTVHRARGTTALYASKTKFALFTRSWADSIDRSVIDEDNGRLVGRLVSDLGSKPARFSFVHLSAPDVAGHDDGFMGRSYLAAVQQVDVLLGQVRAAMNASPALRTGGYLVLTADHGGRGTGGHADPAKVDDYRIPFLVDGPGIPRGDLYALNPDYRDPGTGRPSYDGPRPVRNADLADLSTALLGLSPVPGSVFGDDETLDVR